MAYTKHGPFVNSTAPSIDATFLNDIETTLVALNGAATDSKISSSSNGLLTLLGLVCNPTAISVSGTVSGTTTIYQYMLGTVKRVLVVWNNYKSAAAQTLKLPISFGSNSLWQVTELQGGKLEGLASGSAQTFSIQTSAAVGGGAQTAQAYINSWSMGLCRGGFDTLRITVTGATAASAVATIEGT